MTTLSRVLDTPARTRTPTAVPGTAPIKKRQTTDQSISPRLHQMRATFPSSIVTVRTGTAARTPMTAATTGSRITPAPKPATPATVEPTSAVTTRMAQCRGSGMESVPSYAECQVARRPGECDRDDGTVGSGSGRLRRLARLARQHRLPRHGGGLRCSTGGDVAGSQVSRP